mmetsp:Transcript_7062/g.14782  ORF Transcript_7062/g.14782 Transcript_7062/m.14782 type:complete len:181 (+) Transcript_7062:97-639(+)
MNDILKLAKESGLSKEQGEVTTGGVFSLLKNNLDESQFKKITDSIPGSQKLMDQFVKGGSSSASPAKKGGGGGGALGGLMGMFGKKKKEETPPEGGGGDRAAPAPGDVSSVTDLMGMLGKQGVSAKDVTSFLPKLTDAVKTKSGVDVGSILGGAKVDMKSIEGLVPGVGNFTSKMPAAAQ